MTVKYSNGVFPFHKTFSCLDCVGQQLFGKVPLCECPGPSRPPALAGPQVQCVICMLWNYLCAGKCRFCIQSRHFHS